MAQKKKKNMLASGLESCAFCKGDGAEVRENERTFGLDVAAASVAGVGVGAVVAVAVAVAGFEKNAGYK